MRIRLETLLDVSRPLREGMPVWPGDAPFGRVTSLADGVDGCVSVSTLTLSSHAGTHTDAPRHVERAAAAVDELGLGAFVGPARVVDARGRRALDKDLVSSATLASGRRLLFRTDVLRSGSAKDAAAPAYGPDIPYLTPALARVIAAGRIPLVGVDGPSVDPFDSRSLEAHRRLVSAGVAILEGLDLSAAEPGEWVLIALPLRLEGCDASPVRAVLARERHRRVRVD